jgi:hypothetical protein
MTHPLPLFGGAFWFAAILTASHEALVTGPEKRQRASKLI